MYACLPDRGGAAAARDPSSEEQHRLLFATENSFLHTSLDYAFKLNNLCKRERSFVVERSVPHPSTAP